MPACGTPPLLQGEAGGQSPLVRLSALHHLQVEQGRLRWPLRGALSKARLRGRRREGEYRSRLSTVRPPRPSPLTPHPPEDTTQSPDQKVAHTTPQRRQQGGVWRGKSPSARDTGLQAGTSGEAPGGPPPHAPALQECSRLRPATLWRKAAELAPPLPRPAARPSRAATVTRCARAAAPRPATPSPPRSSPSLTSRRPEPASMPPRNSRPRAEVRGRTPLPNPQPRPRPLRAVRRPPAPPQPPLSCFGAARGGDGRPTRLACVTSGLRARPIRSVRALVGGPAQEFLRGRGGARAPRRGQAQVT